MPLNISVAQIQDKENVLKSNAAEKYFRAIEERISRWSSSDEKKLGISIPLSEVEVVQIVVADLERNGFQHSSETIENEVFINFWW